METFIQQIINGLVLGSMYALVALGYTMVYGIINLINFAHGEVLMVGALVSWTIVTAMADSGLPGWLLLLISLVASIVVCAALNFTIEKVAYRPLRNAPRLAPLITAATPAEFLDKVRRDFSPKIERAVPRIKPYSGPALLSYGFRPFFLLGSLWGGLEVLVWLPVLYGDVTIPTAFSARD